VDVKTWPSAGVRFRDDERHGLETVLVAREAMCELARDAVVMVELIERENQSRGIVRLPGRMVEILRWERRGHCRRRLVSVPSARCLARSRNRI
jgi:hypothetical protein